MEAQLATLPEQQQLLQQYKSLSSQLAEAKRAGADAEALKAEHKRVYDRLQQIAPRKQRAPKSGTPELRVEVITSPAELEAVREPWDDLLQRAQSYSPFLTWQWWWPWAKCFRAAHEPYLLVVRDQDHRLLGGAPLAVMPDGRQRVLRFMGSHGGPDPAHLSLPVVPEHREPVLRAIMQRLAGDCGESFTTWRWEQCAVDGHLGATLAAAAREGLQASVQVKRHYVHGDLPRSFEGYVSSVENKNRRNYLRHQFDRLAREWAAPVFELHTEASGETFERIRQLARYNIRKRQTLGDHSRWQEAGFGRCLDEVVGLFAERGWLRLYSLSVEGQLAAALLGWAYHGTFFAYQIGETESHPELGLGQCVISQAIKGSIEEGLERFEFLGEAHPWKQTYLPGLTGAATLLLGKDNCAYWSQLGWSSLRRAAARRWRGR